MTWRSKGTLHLSTGKVKVSISKLMVGPYCDHQKHKENIKRCTAQLTFLGIAANGTPMHHSRKTLMIKKKWHKRERSYANWYRIWYLGSSRSSKSVAVKVGSIGRWFKTSGKSNTISERKDEEEIKCNLKWAIFVSTLCYGVGSQFLSQPFLLQSRFAV